MKNILVSNITWKELHKLKRTLNLRNTNQVIEHLLDNMVNPDILDVLEEIKNSLGYVNINSSIASLLIFYNKKFPSKIHRDLIDKYVIGK